MTKSYTSIRAKPQNRTEISPTTMECSTIELGLPVIDSLNICLEKDRT